MATNWFEMAVPSGPTDAITTTAIKDAMIPYSSIVTPLSFCKQCAACFAMLFIFSIAHLLLSRYVSVEVD